MLVSKEVRDSIAAEECMSGSDNIAVFREVV